MMCTCLDHSPIACARRSALSIETLPASPSKSQHPDPAFRPSAQHWYNLCHRTHGCTHARAFPHTNPHECIHNLTHETCMNPQTCTHAHMPTTAQTKAHIDTPPHPTSYTHTHTHAHTIHIHTRTHIHTPPHTPTPNPTHPTPRSPRTPTPSTWCSRTPRAARASPTTTAAWITTSQSSAAGGRPPCLR